MLRMPAERILAFAASLVAIPRDRTRFLSKTFVLGRWAPRPGAIFMGGGSKARLKFYAVHRGRDGFRGVLNDWPSCQRVVSGVSNAVFKSFTSRSAAAAFVEFGPHGASRVAKPAGSQGALSTYLETNAAKEGPVPARSGSYSRVASEEGPNEGGSVVTVYTDGACVGNGKSGAAAGVGVYFGDGDPRNVSEKLPGQVQTNQRAEQTAVLRALEIVSRDRLVGSGDTLTIKTDSKYTMMGVTSWMRKWKNNAWKTVDGSGVKNSDLWKALDSAKSQVENTGAIVRFEWVRGHAGDYGNEQADSLAVRGIRGV